MNSEIAKQLRKEENHENLHVLTQETYSQVPNKRVYSFIPNERVGLLF